MAYLPKNKYKVLYTNGNEYRSTKTGKPYTGEYIRLNDGRIFAGNHPSDLKGPLELIPKLRNKNVLTNNVNNRVYQILNKERTKKQDSYIKIHSSKPLPTAEDYNNSFFIRYFSVRLNTKEYQEISKDVYENFNDRKYNRTLNKIFFIKWSLTEDNRAENTIMLEKIEPSLPGFSDVFPDKGEYGIRGGIVRINTNTKTYIDGNIIDKNLPAAYQLGNKNPNSVENPNVPKNHHCGNCIFYKNMNCSRWEAKVKTEFYCKAYKGKWGNNLSTYIDPDSPSAELLDFAQQNQSLPSLSTDTSTDETISSPLSSPLYGGDDPIDVAITPTKTKSPTGPSGPTPDPNKKVKY
jgi:hypothetical protein